MKGLAPDRPRPRVASITSREAVAQAEAYLRAHIDAPVPVSSLCHLVGLSERGLRDAFYRVRGMGPKRWIVAERLQGVRNVLSDRWAGPTTVTHAASEYGFYEFGRFAALYREAFGETPSDTLRFTSRNAAAADYSKTRTHRCIRQQVT